MRTFHSSARCPGDVGRSCAQVTQKHMSFDAETAKAVSSQILYQEQQVTFSRSAYRQNLTNMNLEKKHFWNLPINTKWFSRIRWYLFPDRYRLGEWLSDTQGNAHILTGTQQNHRKITKENRNGKRWNTKFTQDVWAVEGVDDLEGTIFAYCSSKETAEKAKSIVEQMDLKIWLK